MEAIGTNSSKARKQDPYIISSGSLLKYDPDSISSSFSFYISPTRAPPSLPAFKLTSRLLARNNHGQRINIGSAVPSIVQYEHLSRVGDEPFGSPSDGPQPLQARR